MESYRDWEKSFQPIWAGTLVVLDQCDRMSGRQWAPALVSNADQLRTASRTLEAWISDHPCTDGNLETTIARAARSFAYAASGLESAATQRSCTWLVVDRELNGLHKMVAKVNSILIEGTRPKG